MDGDAALQEWFAGLGLHPTYLCAQTELSQNQGEHWQGYLELPQKCYLSQLSSKFSASFQPRNGTAKQAADYCRASAVGDPKYEYWSAAFIMSHAEGVVLPADLEKARARMSFGEISVPTQGKRNDLLAVQEQLDAGIPFDEVQEEFFATCIRYERSLSAYADKKTPPRTWRTKCWILWGPAGSGKTSLAFRYLSEAFGGPHKVYWQDQSKWWDGYRGQPAVLIDEFDGVGSEWTPNLWKRIVDRYPLRLQCKGGYKNIAPKVIIFTSNSPVDDWWNGLHGDALEQIQRRCDGIIHCPTTLELFEDNWRQHRVVQRGVDLPISNAGPGRPFVQEDDNEVPFIDLTLEQ